MSGPAAPQLASSWAAIPAGGRAVEVLGPPARHST
jgi:hypothetical protein